VIGYLAAALGGVLGALARWGVTRALPHSTFAVDTVQLADAGAPEAAVGYVVASVLGGVLAVVAGLTAGRQAVRAARGARSDAGGAAA
jgi:CrcB protein